ncbi:MAG: hypothetical protein ACYSO7_09505, partial [Planctomycetota bacterium]
MLVFVHGMPLKYGDMPALLLGPFGPISKVRQIALFDHPVQGLVADIHLLHHFLHGDDDFRTIFVMHTNTSLMWCDYIILQRDVLISAM